MRALWLENRQLRLRDDVATPTGEALVRVLLAGICNTDIELTTALDHREAIRRAFRSALLDICGRRVRIDRAWTTREMLATLSADADLLAVLAPAAAAFDSAWYGAEPVGAAQWEIARARCEAVRQIARHASGAPAA